MEKKYIFAIALFAIVIITLFWSAAEFFREDSVTLSQANSFSAQKNTGELPEKCKMEEGYTPEEWKEHMSHHPDIYAECL